MRNHEQAHLEARATAGDWHGGQSTELYAFASSGRFSDYERLRDEAHGCLRYAGETQRAKLAAMLRACEAQHKDQSRKLADSLSRTTNRPEPRTIEASEPGAMDEDKARITQDMEAAQGMDFGIYLAFMNHYGRVLDKLAEAYRTPRSARVQLARHVDQVIERINDEEH